MPVHSVEKIEKCHLYTEGTSRVIQTEGLNMEEVWKRAGSFDMNKMTVTDVHAFSAKYGVL